LRFRAYREAAIVGEIPMGTERPVPMDYTPRAQFRLSPSPLLKNDALTVTVNGAPREVWGKARGSTSDACAFRAYREAAIEREIAKGTERPVPLDYTPRAQFRLSPSSGCSSRGMLRAVSVAAVRFLQWGRVPRQSAGEASAASGSSPNPIDVTPCCGGTGCFASGCPAGRRATSPARRCNGALPPRHRP